MKTLIFAILLFLALVPNGCTSIASEATELELEFHEKIVVSGLLHAGDTIQNIWVSRTIPATEEATVGNISLPDADVRLTVNNGTTYKMELQPPNPIPGRNPPPLDTRSLFCVRGLIAENGKTYSIKVNWGGKTAEATTTIPPRPSAPTYTFTRMANEFGQETQYVLATFTPRPNETYQVGTRSRILRIFGGYNDLTPQIILERNVARLEDADGTLTMRTSTYSQAWLDSLVEVQLLLYAYDKPYYDYVRSLGGRTNDLVFNVPTNNPKWNVTGDGIGLFIGLSTSRTPLRRDGK